MGLPCYVGCWHAVVAPAAAEQLPGFWPAHEQAFVEMLVHPVTAFPCAEDASAELNRRQMHSCVWRLLQPAVHRLNTLLMHDWMPAHQHKAAVSMAPLVDHPPGRHKQQLIAHARTGNLSPRDTGSHQKPQLTIYFTYSATQQQEHVNAYRYT